ncbi:hypothetical protein CFT12S02225_01455 [Campylobacter fetus subsp. testudinum]|uniref:Response regulator n=3 Tax=Campylobacter fetus TaxID=196 RepID=A0AAX0HF89_CAMFE|nr:hypothetical protein [Campylobacter fetus]OCR91746.1 hypothetical protein CFT12S02225_01455 [Campylobacter fetus subsp. testudinum]
MNISSLSTNVFYIDTNQTFSKKLNLRIDNINKENISDKSTDKLTDRFGREVETTDYYDFYYGDINIVQKYGTKTYTKEEALELFMATQTYGILNGGMHHTTYSKQDLLANKPENYANKNEIYYVNYPSSEAGYFMTSDHYKYNEIPQDYYLNSYANSNLIDTKFGKAELFLDLAGDNDKLGVGSFSSNSQLFRFDSDSNGIIDKNDTYFDKLKIRAYDKEGNEVIKQLSEVVDYIDLRDFIDTKSNAIKKWKESVKDYGWDENTYKEQLNRISSYNPYFIFKPEIRYESMSETDLKELSKLANDDGWIDVTNLQSSIGLAYAKKGVNGSYRLEELNFGNADTKSSSYSKYSNEQYSKFNSLYEDYMAEVNALNGFFDSYKQVASDDIIKEFGSVINSPDFKSTRMLKIEYEFTQITGLTFTLDNLQKVKDSFEKDRSATANMLIDTDILTAIKINKNGTFTLKFNSGREFVVDKLYKDTGKVFEAGIELNLSEFMDEKDLNQMDFSVSAAKVRNSSGEIELISLKDLGVEMIKKLANGRYKLFTDIQNNKSITVSDIYTKYIFGDSNLNNSNLNNSNSINNSNLDNSNKTIDEKDKFYPKPLRVWA